MASLADHPNFDELVAQALRDLKAAPAPRVAKRLTAIHRERVSPQAVASAFGRLAMSGRARRAGTSRTRWEVTR